MFGKRKLTIKW